MQMSKQEQARQGLPFYSSRTSGAPEGYSNEQKSSNFNVKSLLLYSAETWKTTKTTIDEVQTLIKDCLKIILDIRLPDKTSNGDPWTGTRPLPAGGRNRTSKTEMGRAHVTKIGAKHHQTNQRSFDAEEEEERPAKRTPCHGSSRQTSRGRETPDIR